MSNIYNIAKLKGFTYTCGTKPISDATERTSATTNPYTGPSVQMTKLYTNDVRPDADAADYLEKIWITYTLKDVTTTTHAYDQATITDKIFTLSGIQVGKGEIVGGTIDDHGVITVTTPPKTTDPSPVEIRIPIYVTSPSAATNILYTNAEGNLSTGEILTAITAHHDYDYNHAELAIQKTASIQGTVTAGNRITYTITLTNSGNVTATIPGDVTGGLLVDPIPAFTQFVRIESDSDTVLGYFQASNQVANITDIVIPQNQTKSFSFTVEVLGETI